MRLILENVDYFCGELLFLERRALRKAGLDDAAVDSVIEEGTRLRRHVRMKVPRAEDVRIAVRRLQKRTCNGADTLVALGREADTARGRRRIITRVGLGLGGSHY